MTTQPEWPLVKNILDEYGLDAIAFVAEWKAAQQQAEPVAKMTDLRQAAKAKLDDDDDTQVYADTLLLVYQRGFADGKGSAKPLTDEKVLDIADNYKSQYKHGGTTYDEFNVSGFARAIEAAHGIKEKNT